MSWVVQMDKLLAPTLLVGFPGAAAVVCSDMVRCSRLIMFGWIDIEHPLTERSVYCLQHLNCQTVNLSNCRQSWDRYGLWVG